MAARARSFATFLLLNLAAAYAPGLCWVPSLPGSGSPWLLPLSPVMIIVLLVWSDNPVVLGTVLTTFLLVLVAFSAWLHRLPWARVFLPGLLFVLSLLQGLLAARIISGIDAIGHS
jgi:hypothetical protein